MKTVAKICDKCMNSVSPWTESHKRAKEAGLYPCPALKKKKEGLLIPGEDDVPEGCLYSAELLMLESMQDDIAKEDM